MARDLTNFRETLRRAIRNAGGIAEDLPLDTPAQLAAAFAAADIEKLPVDITNLTELQGVGGGFFFMVDQSAIDGPDPIQ